MKLESLLLEQPMMDKLAVVESPNGQQLEQDFGKLAFAFLRDRAPKLISNLIGFEIVESNPDGSRALGLFGFKIGSGIYYVPAFFMNNQIKGIVELYSRDQDQFVPLRESWINHILSRQSIDLGEPGEATVRESFTVPDFGIMASPPQLGAGGRDSGAIKASGAKEIMADLRAHFIKVAGQTLSMLETDPEMKQMLVGLVASYRGVPLAKTAAQDSKLIRFVKLAGGPGAAKTLAAWLRDPAYARAACTFYDPRDLLISEFSDRFEPKTAADKVTVVSTDDSPVAERTPENKTKLVHQGFYIDDKRSKDETSEAFDFVSDNSISNPAEPGVYHVLMTGGVNTVNVVMPNVPQFANRMVLVFDSKGNFFTAHARRVFVLGSKITPEEKESVYDKGIDPADMKIGETYVLVNENMKASCPFSVTGVVKGGDAQRFVVDYRNSIKYDCDRDDAGASLFTNAYDTVGGYPGTNHVNVYISPTAGQLRPMAESLVVPQKSWKAIRLNRPDDWRQREALERAFSPASYSEITENMIKAGAHDVHVNSDDGGLSYTIIMNEVNDVTGANFKSACVRLVKDYGLGVDDAEIMLKEAATKFKSRRLVKFAQVPSQVVPPPLPAINPGGYDQVVGVPVQNPQVSYTQGQTVVPPPRPSGPGSGVNVGGEAARQQASGAIGASNSAAGQAGATPDSLAQEAAQTGQQQVFDQASIGSMARTYDTSGMIDTFVPDFMKSLDKLGRLIFMFYWKNDDFAERFGSQDLNELEDSLTSVFRNYGDLILKLKQKTLTDEDRFYI